MNSSSYLDRARALMKRNTLCLGALAILPIAAAVTPAHAVTAVAQPFSITGTTQKFPSSSGGTGQPPGENLSTATLANGVKFYGGFGPATGSQFNSVGPTYQFGINGTINANPGIAAGTALA